MYLHECWAQDMQVVHKLRPIRVAARRQWELIAIVDAEEFDDAEWIGEDHAKLTGVIPVETVVTSGIPVMDMTTHFVNSWAAD